MLNIGVAGDPGVDIKKRPFIRKVLPVAKYRLGK
jgi:hypothetical protein